MSNLEHIIENTLDAFSEGYTAEQIMGFIKTDMNFPEQPLTVEQIYEICQYVWCAYLDNGNELKKNNPPESMTNAEMLTKDPSLMMNVIAGLCMEVKRKCRNCPLKHIDCSDEEVIKEWLEQEADEIERIIL